jgi:endonuclease YncB( thermonuclease family)
MVDPAYRYAAAVVRVIDGDGLAVDVDLGFGVWLRGLSVRLAGVNARELSQLGGPQARDHLAALLGPAAVVTLTSVRHDKYGGRSLATVTLPDGRDLATLLLATGWAS